MYLKTQALRRLIHNLHQTTSANNVSSKRLHKTTIKILCTRITTIARLLDVNTI